MKLNWKSAVISLFVGVFFSSGAMLGMNLYEDKHKTAQADAALTEAEEIHEEVNEMASIINTFTDVNQEVKSIPQLRDVIPADQFGTIQGIISVPSRNVKCSLVYGVTEYGLYSNACIHTGSYTNSLVVFGHNYRGGAMFHNLLETEIGDEVIIEYTDGRIDKYNIAERKHVEEQEYNSDTSFVFESDYNLVLITCETTHASSGRCILFCTKQG